MKLPVLFSLVIGLVPMVASATIILETDISQPYEIVPIEVAMPDQVSFLGTLEDFPVMYEIRSDEPFTFTAQLSQPTNQEAQPFSMLLIRRNDRGGGVAEVTRQPFVAEQWSLVRNGLFGVSFRQSPVIEETVEPGTYRLEVSSPDNQGNYLFTVGSQPAEVGYFEQLGYVRQLQSYFGYGFFSMLRSSLVYYPLGILLLLGAIWQTWRWAHKRPMNA